MARPEGKTYSGEGDDPIVGSKSMRFDITPRHFNIEKGEFKDPLKEEELARRLSGVDGESPDSQWFQNIEELIEKGEKHAWYTPTVGKVMFVVVTAAAAIEIKRKGKDV